MWNAIIIKSSVNEKIHIEVDEIESLEILNFLSREQPNKKFIYICNLIVEGIRNTDLYDKEDINNKCKDITAMKFKGGSNGRIYCKEIIDPTHGLVIVMGKYHKKKSEKVSKKEIPILESLAETDYVIKIN